MHLRESFAVSVRFYLVMLALIGFSSLTIQARAANQYDDLAAWAKQDVTNAALFRDELEQAGDRPERIATALQTTAARQHKSTDALIVLVGRHPELRNLPELGLDEEGLSQWKKAHPDAERRRAQVPAEAVRISRELTRAVNAEEQKSQAGVTNLSKHKEDPKVAAAAEHLVEVLTEERRRLLRAFSQPNPPTKIV